MKKSKGKIDWTLAENDEAWQAAQSTMPTEAAPTPLHKQALVLATLIVALILLLTGGWLWQQPIPAKAPPTNLSPTLVRAEQSLTHTIELLDTAVQVDSIQRFGDIQHLGDRLMTQVTVQLPEEGKQRAYRQTRFYQKSGNSWQRIAPVPTLLGPAKTLQIANFTILYHAVDAGAVYESAPKLEKLYTTLRHDVGLPTANANTAYTIEIATARVQGGNNVNFLKRKMTISSPILLSAPVEITPGTLLYQQIIYPLAYLLMLETIAQHDHAWHKFHQQWQLIDSALPLWELWQEETPLSSQRVQIVQWLYDNGNSATTHQPLPNDYARLCATFQIWQIIPLDLSIPLTCTDMDQEVQPIRYPALAPTWPQQTGYVEKRTTLQPSPYAASVTTATVIEYIVATYGRDKLPQLLEAMGQHSTTDTLVRAFFGVSFVDFEAGWKAYLAQHY